jgi:hypothetical protein
MRYPYLPSRHIAAAAEVLIRNSFPESEYLVPPVDLDGIVYDHLCGQGDLAFSNEHDLGYEEGEKVLGVTLIRTGQIRIDRSLLDSDQVGRYRFTVAHELGHWILHRPLFLVEDSNLSMFAVESEKPLISLNRNVFPEGRKRPPAEEWQANQFASFLLIPRKQLAAAVRENHHSLPLRCPDGVSLRAFSRDVAAKPGLHGSLSERFLVSKEAMAIALEANGLVTDKDTLL